MDAVRRKLHQTIHKVTQDIEGLRYNTAIAAMMEYVNTLRDATGLAANEPDARVPRELIEPIIIMLAPLAPHFAEECWERLYLGAAIQKLAGRSTSVFDAEWPEFDAALVLAEDAEVAVQVNGKLRGRLIVPRGLTQQEVVDRALADPGVKRFLDGKPIRKVVYVPDRLLNLVV